LIRTIARVAIDLKFACGGVLLDSGTGPNGEGDRRYQLQYLDALFAAIRGIFMSSYVLNVRSQPDRVLVEIDYVMNYKVASDLAYETLDPVQAAFNIGTMIRWLDFNDTWPGDATRRAVPSRAPSAASFL
jgi:hypothetical protein